MFPGFFQGLEDLHYDIPILNKARDTHAMLVWCAGDVTKTSETAVILHTYGPDLCTLCFPQNMNISHYLF